MRIVTLILLTLSLNSCATVDKFSTETCETITKDNAPICDPDGDLANGDYDAA